MRMVFSALFIMICASFVQAAIPSLDPEIPQICEKLEDEQLKMKCYVAYAPGQIDLEKKELKEKTWETTGATLVNLNQIARKNGKLIVETDAINVRFLYIRLHKPYVTEQSEIAEVNLVEVEGFKTIFTVNLPLPEEYSSVLILPQKSFKSAKMIVKLSTK